MEKVDNLETKRSARNISCRSFCLDGNDPKKLFVVANFR